jgi:SPX domain protein involved in polyphosphate accumulation
MKKIFERKEQKYLLNQKQKEALLKTLASYLQPDLYSDYSIQSVYYDNDQFDLFRKSIEKPEYKEKLRLRCYGYPHQADHPAFLEIKKKYAGVVYKRRIDLPLNEAYDFALHPRRGTVSENEIYTMIERYDLKPQVYVSYDRQAFVWKSDPDLRITFDSNIRYRLSDLYLESTAKTTAMLPENEYILEIKSLSNLPRILVSALNRLQIWPASFSKVGYVYKEVILQKEGRHA